MPKQLHQKQFEKDSCGVGLIVNLDNKASPWLVETAINSLSRLAHRGAVAPDGKTGDGCGILLRKPDEFLQALARKAKIKLAKNYAVGCIFTNSNKTLSSNALARLKKELREEKLEVALERLVPIDASACGEDALKTLPQIYHIFVNAPKDMAVEDFERKLYIARRKTELALECKDEYFYVASLSSQTLSYKGMIMPEYLTTFYPDLKDPLMSSSLCLFHQRFSTNTFPEWRLAQPFRMLAHNGEINTINGNRNWSVSRESKFLSEQIPNLSELMPLISKEGSDSMSLDNMLEALVMTGVDILHAMRILVPPAWQNSLTMDEDLRAMYEYYSLDMDPWDGPAALALTDGNYAACAMDRNGLRPSRYVITKDRHLTVASEIGVYDYAPEDVVAKGRLKPGEMLAVDLNKQELLFASDIDKKLSSRYPYKEWLEKYTRYLKPIPEEEEPGADPIFKHELEIYQKQFQLTLEERERMLKALGAEGQEPLGSMGDDTPLAVLSNQKRSLYEYFRQQFAQVTNPPIDPIREQSVMSLRTCLGRESNPFTKQDGDFSRIDMVSPILSRYMFKSLLTPDDSDFSYETIDLTYNQETSLENAILDICDRAERAVRKGKTFLVLTDRRIRRDRIPVHALLAVGAVNARLCKEGLRCDANIIVETATARDPHHYAALIAFGATAIYPYLAYQVLYDMAQHGEIDCKSTVELMQNYREAIKKGLLKIMSKMGISTINSYRGAQLFEAIGLHEEVIELCFPGTISRIQGATFQDLEAEYRELTSEAWDTNRPLEIGGLMKYSPSGEYHAFNPDVVMTLQAAVKSADYAEFKKYTQLVDNRPYTALRDMLALKKSEQAISIDEVEPVAAITARFCSAAMSIGALSPEAHEALAIAMNRIGGQSNSGEGGEDPIRYGTEKSSKIKQIASGRFGVTPEYLINAEVLQIKIAQGAKPGEGGQLPGHKVNELIARLRHTKPGTSLISPPPHHDIYSIEDLSQLIFDLKQINPAAQVSVKLVAESGVGTVAAGVAKTYADAITVSGHDGGTGASPISSIRYAGIPWEMGLVETHQVLRANNLRDKVRLQTDGGLKTGLDIVKAAILGAESFGFGTAPLIALGCKFLRICHLNNCATGIATQNPFLRQHHFKGLPEMLETYFNFVAEEIRELLASVGARSLEEIIGQTDLLTIVPGITAKQKNLALDVLLAQVEAAPEQPHYCTLERNNPYDKNPLAEQMLADSLAAIEARASAKFDYRIQNTNRSIGARISGEIARRYGDAGLGEASLNFNFQGTAGQSFAVWNISGVHMRLEGDANDYVGKGMAGGSVVIYPPANSSFRTEETSIIGNTCLYGATGGKLFAAGQAGERFAVRNSGALTVVEGAGNHCCEYMTDGVVVVLGTTGNNFGAGMTGGLAFVYDQENDFTNRYNNELVEILRIDEVLMNDYAEFLRDLVEEHLSLTNSAWAKELLNSWSESLAKFYVVKAKAQSLELINDYKSKSISRAAAH